MCSFVCRSNEGRKKNFMIAIRLSVFFCSTVMIRISRVFASLNRIFHTSVKNLRFANTRVLACMLFARFELYILCKTTLLKCSCTICEYYLNRVTFLSQVHVIINMHYRSVENPNVWLQPGTTPVMDFVLTIPLTAIYYVLLLTVHVLCRNWRAYVHFATHEIHNLPKLCILDDLH